MSAGARFRAALKAEHPLQIAGTINAYTALLAERAGFRTIYLSGAGVANASFGMPDLAMTTLNDVCEDIRRITSVTATWKIRSPRSAAAIVPARHWSQAKKCAIA